MKLAHPAALAAMMLVGCAKTSNPDANASERVAANAAPGPAAVRPSAPAPVVRNDPRWRMSSAPCPVAMTAPPAPRPGANLGDLALEQGHRPDQLYTTIVPSFPEAWTPASGDGVPVLYVESSRTEPVLDSPSQTFTPGASEGTAYIFDRRSETVGCMARVRAASSGSVTSLGAGDRQALMWLTMDLQFAIERDIVADARAITVGEDAGAAVDAGGARAGSSSRPRTPRR